jgi:hypothetical protein
MELSQVQIEGMGCPPNPDYFYDPEDEDRDGLQNGGLYKTEPPHPADNPRKLHYTHSPGKHQILYSLMMYLG